MKEKNKEINSRIWKVQQNTTTNFDSNKWIQNNNHYFENEIVYYFISAVECIIATHYLWQFDTWILWDYIERNPTERRKDKEINKRTSRRKQRKKEMKKVFPSACVVKVKTLLDVLNY